ncbi:hypothetical protein Pelo_17368 [Pelomyxa schiedti]|nr:hypothetical protein Pelo_17368 [Pelomyxa schiedti]
MVPKPAKLVKRTPRWRLCIPRGNIKLRLMQNHHDDLKGGGHRSSAKMYIVLSEKYWWPTMFQDLKEWVKSCPECQKFRKHKPSYQPKSILATEPNEYVAIDLWGPFPETKSGKTLGCVMVDLHTKAENLA